MQKVEIGEVTSPYYIKIGDLEVGNTVYHNRCMSVNYPKSEGDIVSEIIPWAGTSYRPYDYKYENGEYILDVIDVPAPVPVPTESEILRADVDYLLMMQEG